MSTYALELKDLRKNFGKTEIIRGVNLAVAPGERVAFVRGARRGATGVLRAVHVEDFCATVEVLPAGPTLRADYEDICKLDVAV
jgi:ABC-type histidine transport system ATPase subunit